MSADILQLTPRDTSARDRNRARLNRYRNLAEPICDLAMGHADPEDTAPSDYVAPAHDGA